jgi:bidirectional [NiFe] hydrogenase diaphorase subunit
VTPLAPVDPTTVDDPRYLELDKAIRQHHNRPDGLIEVLHVAQRLFGYLPREVLAYIARALSLPPSAVYGVATFYHFFSIAPAGAHTVTVCTGTACHVNRGTEILHAIERAIGVRVGHTTGDGTITVAEARCLGPCSQAPVVVFDDEITGELGADAVLARLDRWRTR